MSYSFSARGATKEAVLKSVEEKLDGVVASQPVHAADRNSAFEAVKAYIDLVTLPAGKDYSVAVHGSVGWNADAPEVLTGAGVGVSVSYLPSEQKA